MHFPTPVWPLCCNMPQDTSEHAMVRHEAAEALGAIAQPECVALLQQLASDPEPVVAHSCVVALDMLESERAGEFEYAAMPQDVGA